MSDNNNNHNHARGVTGSDSAVDYAVEAGKRLRGAAGKVGDAYADACQQTMLGLADFRDRAAGSTPVDWLESVLTGQNQPGDHWRTSASAAMQAEEVGQAGKEIARAYIDAHERAALIAIELRESLAAATGTDWIKSMARTQAELERDAANACFSLARGLLM